ncbi:Major facilitator superfamily domain, general substrate transporter [Nannochloropsis gaditana]|uniref:Major facilitator superfamily domain, general substrate transporter n=1 Tax=Nannochloropsis gaditana TaxID=72520 RepID=W7T1K3_9STRA|nr:Major facilitator superfamily domain, general substrate transporter [Nannochloropsis gaditana]
MKTRGPDKGTSSSEGPERGVELENDERGMSDTYQGPVPNTSTKPLLLPLSMTSLDVNSAASKHKGDALILSGEPHTDLSPAMAVAEHKGTARYRELLYVYLAIVADAVTSNVMAPYAQEWVLHTFQTNNIGLYSGILVGSMAFARALSSPFFGWLSDSIGRRLDCGDRRYWRFGHRAGAKGGLRRQQSSLAGCQDSHIHDRRLYL